MSGTALDAVLGNYNYSTGDYSSREARAQRNDRAAEAYAELDALRLASQRWHAAERLLSQNGSINGEDLLEGARRAVAEAGREVRGG